MLQDAGLSEKAIKHALGMIEISRNLDLPKYESIAHSYLANVYHDIAFYEKGIFHGKNGVQIALNKVSDGQEALFASLNAIAINYDDWNKPDSAIFYHRKVLSLDTLMESDLMQTCNNIGNTFMKKGLLDSADYYISKSVRLNQIGRSSHGLATSMNNKADVLIRRDKIEEAKMWLDSALIFALDSESLEKKRDVYNTYYRYCETKGDAMCTVKYLQLFHATKDSMVNTEKLQVIKDLEKEKLQAEKEKVIAEKELELRKRNIWIIIFVAVILLVLALLRQLVLKKEKLAQKAKLDLQDERLRISRDLHDNIGSELTYMASVIDQKLYVETDEKLKAELSELGDSSRSAMSQLRETIWAIKTEGITLDKFRDKLIQLTLKYSKTFNIELTVDFSGLNHKLTTAQVINLFRVCQEAINNSFKYSGCRNIIVQITGNKEAISFSISDDGVGFVEAEIKRGYGLNNMQERVEELKGSFTINSEKNKGTLLEFSVPLNE